MTRSKRQARCRFWVPGLARRCGKMLMRAVGAGAYHPLLEIIGLAGVAPSGRSVASPGTVLGIMSAGAATARNSPKSPRSAQWSREEVGALFRRAREARAGGHGHVRVMYRAHWSDEQVAASLGFLALNEQPDTGARSTGSPNGDIMVGTGVRRRPARQARRRPRKPVSPRAREGTRRAQLPASR